MTSIDAVINKFSSVYRGKVIVKPMPVELTECFRNNHGQITAPRSYGNLEEDVVMAYVVQGRKLGAKYEIDEHGDVVRNNGSYVVMDFDNDMIVISCLCLRDIRNTSLQEVRGPLLAGAEQIQGYCRWQIINIVRTLPNFDPDSDSAFIFAGRRNDIYYSIALNTLWFRQIIQSGSRMLRIVDGREAELMQKVFPAEVLSGDQGAIEQASYMYDRPLYRPESTEFLQRKVEAYQRFTA